jgi:hypothetical protein
VLAGRALEYLQLLVALFLEVGDLAAQVITRVLSLSAEISAVVFGRVPRRCSIC